MQIPSDFVHKQGDRHPPGTLTGNTPVRALGKHAVDPRASPVGDPLHAVYGLLGCIKQAVTRHADKPLWRRSENDGRFMTPAVRVAVLEGSMTEQDVTLCERGNNVVIGLKNMLSGKDRRVGVIHPVTPHWVIHLKSVAATHLKVFKAMGWCSMHAPGACFGGHVLTQYDWYRVLAKGRR